MKITIPAQRVFLNKMVQVVYGGKKCYKGYTNLGKGKGAINIKCWSDRHDLTKLRWLDCVVADLKSYKDINNIVRFEMVILDYAEPKMGDWVIQSGIPVKKEPVKTPDIAPDTIVDVNEAMGNNENQIDINELIENYEGE